jgi:hypothetical protein
LLTLILLLAILITLLLTIILLLLLLGLLLQLARVLRGVVLIQVLLHVLELLQIGAQLVVASELLGDLTIGELAEGLVLLEALEILLLLHLLVFSEDLQLQIPFEEHLLVGGGCALRETLTLVGIRH